MKVFLDLEGTVINNWDDALLLNKCLDIRSWLKCNRVKEVAIFSAAIWNEADKQRFEKVIKPFLEDALDVKIMEWPSMEDVWKSTTWKGVGFENVCEMISLIGKKRMFEDWCLEKERGNHSILIDDSFGNWAIEHHDSHTSIGIVHVDKI